MNTIHHNIFNIDNNNMDGAVYTTNFYNNNNMSGIGSYNTNQGYGEEEDVGGEYDSEYEWDLSSNQSLHSYSSADTFSDSDFCLARHPTTVSASFKKMTTITQDLEMIDEFLRVTPLKAIQSIADATIVVEQPLKRVVSVEMSNRSKLMYARLEARKAAEEMMKVPDAPPPPPPSEEDIPWKKTDKTDNLSLRTIISDENLIFITEQKKIEEAKALLERERANYMNRGQNQRNSQQQRRDYNNKDRRGSMAGQRQAPKQGNERHERLMTNNKQTTGGGTIPSNPPKRVSLLRRDDNKTHSKTTASDTRSTVSSDHSTAADMSRICKFAAKCSFKSKCGRAHAYNEWEPRKCHFTKGCKSMRTCRYIHDKESKSEYLRRIVQIEDTFYNKNKEIYLKNFNLS